MPEQWVILTAMEGRPENDLVGPFASLVEAQQWMDDNEPYLDEVVDEALELWESDGGSGDSPTVHQRVRLLNHPTCVGPSE